MFWKYNNPSSSQIEAALAKEDVTLLELMDEEDIINECKLQNKSLIDFITKPEIIEELVTLTTVEPSMELDERTRFKYSNIACEILTSDVSALNERLASDQALLSKLYMFLDSEPPLNPLLASFFSKIMGVLIAKKTEQVLDFLKAKDNFVSILLKHFGTSAIMDLTLKLMTQVEGVEIRQNVLNWLNNQRIIQSLVSLLDPAVDRERHCNVAQLLCDFINIHWDNQRNSTERNDPDPLLTTLQSAETVTLLLDHMLGENKSESCIVGGIQVILSLLDTKRMDYDEYKQKKPVLQDIRFAILKRLRDFHNLLLDPPKKAPIKTTFGTLNPPLGNTRLQVIKLFAAIISTDNPDILKEIISLGTVQVLLDLFFAFPWNNFLHTQVQKCIISALEAHIPLEPVDDDYALYKHLLVDCKLIERILEAWKDDKVQEKESKIIQQGYMGHLTNIAISIKELCSTSPPFQQFFKDSLPSVFESFEEFSDTTLTEIKRTQAILLGGDKENGDEYGDVPFQQPNLIQQVFTQYQIHQIRTQLVNSCSFNDDDFNDGDDTLQTIDLRMGMNFDLSEGDLVQQHELFKQVCAQNINTLDDDDDQIFGDRDHSFQTIIEKLGVGERQHDAAAYSSDSDEDDSPPPTEDPFMDLDSWGTPSPQHRTSESAIAPVTLEDPWSMTEKAAVEANTGWASFSSPSFANFEANFDDTDKNITATAAMATDATISSSENTNASETDLKIENLKKLDSSSEIKKEVEEEKCSKNYLKPDSIENVAQVVNKEDSCENVNAESLREGDRCEVQQTEINNAIFTTAQLEPDQKV